MAANPTLKQLKYLCAVAETRHFGKAAARCFVTQSTLSAGIQELERVLNATLLERAQKQVILTAAGEKIVGRAINILTEVGALKEDACLASTPLSSRIKIGAIPTIAPFLLPDVLTRVRADYPQLQLLIREDLSAHLVNLLNQGDLDLILLALPYPVGDACQTMPLFHDNFLVAHPKHHPFTLRQHIDPGDLRGEDIVLLEQGHCLRDHILQACHLTENELSLQFEATSLHTIVPMIANGVGLTLLPAMAYETGILANIDNVATTAFKNHSVWREIGLVWRKNSPRANDYLLLGEYFAR